MTLSCELDHAHHFSHFSPEEGVVWSGVVIDQPALRANSIRFTLKIDRGFVSEKFYKTAGKLMVYVPHDSLVPVDYGDRVVFSEPLSRIKEPSNPDEFNYARYLANKNVFHQVFIPAGRLLVTGKNNGNMLQKFAYDVRNRFMSIFKRYDISGKEFAIASALLIGYDDMLDPEQRRQFSGAGAMHILCVSGLHVGIIFLIADKLFFFLRRPKFPTFLRPVFIIAAIWLYALITGLAPSVMRAALMFTLVTIGGSLNRQSHIFNTLSASAFILLLLNPAMLWEVGFQLSYAAVLGIVVFQPQFKRLYSPVGKLPSYIWDILLVSLAAQLATAPVSIMYFHQFPNYFLLTNLLVIPLAGLLLYTGVVFIFLSFIPLIGKFAALILVWEIKFLSKSVAFIEQLPGAVSRDLYLSLPGTLLLYILIIALLGWWVSRRKAWRPVIMIVLLLIAIDYTRISVHRATQHMVVVHHIHRNSAISFIHGKKHLLLTDSVLTVFPQKLDYSLQNFRIKAGLRSTTAVRLDSALTSHDMLYLDRGLALFHNKRFAIVSSGHRLPERGKQIKVNYVILTSNVRYKAAELATYFPEAEFIIDASNSYRRALQWSEDFHKLNINCYNIHEKGAWVFNLTH
ncbi:ComEC/Rec2 family competence protein [Lentimicrobium sp.]